MTKIWPHDLIRELLAQADIHNEARAELKSKREAELFRFAAYHFRRTNKLGLDLSITIDNNIVIVSKRPTPTVTLLQ